MNTKSLKPGWKMVKFGDVVKNVNLVEHDIERVGIKRIVGLEHIDTDNLHICRWDNPENGTSFTRKFVPGQTLFGKRRAYQRKVAFAEFEGICSGDILTFEPKDPKVLLPELLPFICQTDAFFDYALGTSVGSLSPRTSWLALKEFEFPLPPMDKQKSIAEIIWAADRVLRCYEKAFNDICIYRRQIVESHLNLFKSRELTLTEVLTGSPESGCSSPPSPVDTGHYVLSLAALSADGYSEGNLKPVEKTSKMLSARLRKGDLLISRSNTRELVGFAGIFNEARNDVSFPDTMMRLSVNKEIVLPEYLELVLQSSRGRKHVMKSASGTSNSMKKINRKNLSEFCFPVPVIKDQSEMVSKISKIKAQGAIIKRHIKAAQNLMFILINREIGALSHV